MRFSSVLAGASMLGSVMASPVHEHAAKKRDVVYVTTHQTSVTTVYAGQVPSSIAAAAEAEATTAEAVAESILSEAIATATTEAAATTEAETDSTTSTSTSSAATSSSTSSIDTTDLGSGVKGITYSPYTDAGACKTLDEVKSDFEDLTTYGVIRLYGVDCSQVEYVLQAKSSDQKLFLGVYYMDAIAAGVAEIASAIESYGSWDDVMTVSIGNELVNSGEASVETVGSYIETGRTALTAAGYSGPVVSVESFAAFLNNPGLCDYNDYVACNAHAYFDSTCTAENAGSWLMDQIEYLWGICDGAKDVLITESGWPSQGDTNGVAVPSKTNQEVAVAAIKESCGDDTILFTAFNDYWKADGSYGVEKYWGILSSE